MTADPRAALSALIAALENHLEMAALRPGEDDPAVIAAYERVAEAFSAYDDALMDAYGEVTPLEVYDEDLVGDDEDDDADDADADDEDDDFDDDDEDDLDDDEDDLDDEDDGDELDDSDDEEDDGEPYQGLDDDEYDVDDRPRG